MFVQRLIDQLAKEIGRLSERFPDPDEQGRVRDLLAAGLREVQESLQESRAIPNEEIGCK
jgi:hypothetical protein